MEKIKKIFVPVDFSKRSREGLGLRACVRYNSMSLYREIEKTILV